MSILAVSTLTRPYTLTQTKRDTVSTYCKEASHTCGEAEPHVAVGAFGVLASRSMLLSEMSFRPYPPDISRPSLEPVRR